MSIATTPEQLAARDSVRAFGRTQGVSSISRDETGDAWRRLWPALGDLGMLGVAVPEDLGGGGGSLADLAVMLEQAGEELIPGPIVTTMIGALLCSGVSVPASVREAIITGALPVALTLTPTMTVVTRDVDGQALLSGAFHAVDGACPDSALIAPLSQAADTDWVVLLPHHGLDVTPLPGIDFAVPLGDVTCRDVPIAAVIDLQRGAVQDLYLAALAAVASGVARRCLDIAASYADLREQFGHKIGRFQAIKHLCAEMLCRAEQASVLAWDLATVQEPDRPLAAAAAGALAFDAAVDNAKDCIQILGGIGFTWEHDAHLYLRRALTLRHHAGGSARWRRRAVEVARQQGGRTLQIDLGEVETQRPAVRADLEQIAAMPADERRKALADSGYLAPQWPEPFGQAASTARQLLISDEMQRAGIDRPDLVIGWWAIPTILEAGTPAQLDRYVGPTLRGELIWCQLFSEPGAGSDLASMSTSATRAQGGWRLTGQKVWNSMATFADWAICLARTDKSVRKHDGITYFLVDMKTPGIDVRPLREIAGETLFNEVFLDEVYVPDDCVLGEVNKGWPLARTTLANERLEMSSATLGPRTVDLLQMIDDSEHTATVEQVGSVVAQAIANSLLAHRTLLARMAGAQPGAEAAVQKLLGVRQRQQAAELTVQLLGANGVCNGPASREFLTTRALSIAGGSTQILLSLVAERLLGLPRD